MYVKPTTVDELRNACKLTLCYDDTRLAELLAQPDARATLLNLPRADARRVLAGLLSHADRVTWAQACAQRARGYAASAASAADAAYADAAYAAYAADAASAYAADAAASAEHRVAVDHALALLGWC